jgi:hypothetical protein
MSDYDPNKRDALYDPPDEPEVEETECWECGSIMERGGECPDCGEHDEGGESDGEPDWDLIDKEERHGIA